MPPYAINNELEGMMREHFHLREYINHLEKGFPQPEYYTELPYSLKDERYPNILYCTKGLVFIHVYRIQGMKSLEYVTIEPHLSVREFALKTDILKMILKKVADKPSVSTDAELKVILEELIEENVLVDERADKGSKNKKNGPLKKENRPIRMTSSEKEVVSYYILKDLVGGGLLECFMRDPYIEDIHVIVGENIHLIHKIFEMIRTNVIITPEEGPGFIKILSERMGSPVSEGRPIVDGVMPDGSRGNIIYSKAVSIKGPSMTIRRFTETPISITQLIKSNTLGAGLASYLWLCLQYGRSFFICGGTACGKTTTMNAIIPFIPPERKIYTAEGTPELQVPHSVWQRLLTKTSGPEEGRVDLFDLLTAALRSRPDYIIPGEVRGAEGSIVFQALQTGHPVITTFHAGSVTKVIQRFTGDPINVPKTFMDNLDFVVIQLAIERNGKTIRRCVSVDEIEGYNRVVDGIMARRAFEWKPDQDSHIFTANKNSFVLEEKIARNAGYADTSEIYAEYDLRKKILERMVEEEIFGYNEVVDCIWSFYRKGVRGLPFSL